MVGHWIIEKNVKALRNIANTENEIARDEVMPMKLPESPCSNYMFTVVFCHVCTGCDA